MEYEFDVLSKWSYKWILKMSRFYQFPKDNTPEYGMNQTIAS